MKEERRKGEEQRGEGEGRKRGRRGRDDEEEEKKPIVWKSKVINQLT